MNEDFHAEISIPLKNVQARFLSIIYLIGAVLNIHFISSSEAGYSPPHKKPPKYPPRFTLTGP